MIERYGESIAGYIRTDLIEFPKNKFTILDFSVEAEYHRNKIPDGFNFNIYFSILSFQVAYELNSLAIIKELPKIELGDTPSTRRNKELEYQRKYRNEIDPISRKPYTIDLKLYPENIDESYPSQVLEVSGSTLYSLGNRGYLPLKVPFLSDGSEVVVNEKFILKGEINTSVTSFVGDIMSFTCFYSGGMNFSLNRGSQNHTFVE